MLKERKYSEPYYSIRGGKWCARVRIYWDGGEREVSARIAEAKKGEEAAYKKAKADKKRPTIPPRVRKAASEWLGSVKAEEADRAARAALEAEDAKEAKEAGPTVADALQAYIDGKALHIEAGSIRGYRTALRMRVRPLPFGALLLNEVTPEDGEKWQRDMARSGVAENTQKKAFALVKSMFKQAVARGLVSRNPLDTLKAKDAPAHNPNVLTQRDRPRVAAFCDIDPADPYSLAYRLALMCGLRRGEACGLQWRDIDFEAGTAWIDRAIGTGEKDSGDGYGYASYYVKSTKNTSSHRRIALPTNVVDALKARRASMQKESLAAGVPFLETFYVLGHVDGTGINPHYIYNRWRGVVVALGLVGSEGNPPTYHDLRHTYATVALQSGIDVKTVSSQMGHANAAMTLNTYASADPDAARRAADIMDKAIKPRATADVITFEKAAGE